MNTPIEKTGAVFFTVKYGRNQAKIFNANCKNDILLHHIKTNCQCSSTDTIELSDERGHVKNIRNNKQDYGIKFIKEREIVILLKVDNTMIEKSKTKYIPLLIELQDNRAFIDAVNFGKMGEEPVIRRRSSTTAPVQNELQYKTGAKSKTGVTTKKKSVSRRQSSRMLLKK